MSVIRLGKREDDRERPVMICFRETTVKNAIMESLNKLSECGGKIQESVSES